MFDNTLLLTDTYKMGHMEQYPDDTEFVYSYLEARKPGHRVVFFGLQYLIKRYLTQPITSENVLEFVHYYERILGKIPTSILKKLMDLANLGYWPIEIKAIAEGSIVDSGNALLTIRNTKPGFYWCVGFLESLILKVWYPCTVATCAYSYWQLVMLYAKETCDNFDHVRFQSHDFGYRGVSSEESAAIAASAFLMCFVGSDTVIANKFIEQYYIPDSPDTPIGLSVPASEHSVMCSYGREGELEAFRHMLKTYPTGVVSIVSDTYNLWNVLENYTDALRDEILGRDGKVVFRPDSGDPVNIICGDADAPEGSPEYKGALEILWEKFDGSVNDKGYKVLNPKVGLIYGDGMYFERFHKMLHRMEMMGFASSNLVIGVGGIMLQNHSRDEFSFALKATHIQRSGSPINIFKDPITDPGKKSKCGLMQVVRGHCGQYVTHDQVTPEQEVDSLLKPVFRDGESLSFYALEDIRETIQYEGRPMTR